MTSHDTLIWKALLALDEAAADGASARHALRFVLAFLHAHSDGDRAPADAFWKAVVKGQGDPAAALAAMMHNVGVKPTAATLTHLRERRPLTAEMVARRTAVDLIAAADRERALDKDFARGLHG